MLHSNALVLFESTTAVEVIKDPSNSDWLGVVEMVSGERYELLERRYYVGLSHLRAQRRRSALPGRMQVSAQSKGEALQGFLELMTERNASEKKAESQSEPAVFVAPLPDNSDETLPISLRDFSIAPPPLRDQLGGRGRPPCDALCLMRAFLAAPLLDVDDSPAAINRLLRSNPTFAAACGFGGRGEFKQPGELTSRRLPGLATLEEFNEVMTRNGLWRIACVGQVEENLVNGVVETEDTLAFDTTHILANSHCGNVVPPSEQNEEQEEKQKQRKVPRARKTCTCGKPNWNECEHSWTPTDQGAAVVVKGAKKHNWAHKASVVSLGESEIPIDVRVLQYAAEHDGKTLIAHLSLVLKAYPALLSTLCYVLADDAYKGNHVAVAEVGEGATLIVPVHPSNRSMADVIAKFSGIDRFTPAGVPVCTTGYHFEMRGRDMERERYIWVAPDDADGHSVCASCPLSSACLQKGTRRHIRVERSDLPQINWDHPQHLSRIRARYAMRSGVERAIKRLKVDLKGENLAYRDSLRVQAHCDRRLLTLHLLLKLARAG